MPSRIFLLALLWFVGLSGSTAAHAVDELAEVTRLRSAGQIAEALKTADALLATRPKDPQMRFMKAGLLAEAMRPTESTAMLEQLTEDYPDLPEPYNNLAGLYAASGNYAKARAALEQALRLKPGYATAHANLGDLYAALAAQSFATALQLDPTLAGVPAKLEQIRQIATPRSLAAPTADAATPAMAR